MNTTSIAGTRQYAVHIQFFSDGVPYAHETFVIDLPSDSDVHAMARALADNSAYDDPRIPDLTRAITIEPIDPEDPDTPPAAPTAPVAIKPMCPYCRTDDITRDATARWDVDTQKWHLSGIFDCQTCGDCGAEGDDLARWVPATGMTPADEFFRAVLDILNLPALVRNPTFESFCAQHFGTMAPEDAASLWRAQNPRSS